MKRALPSLLVAAQFLLLIALVFSPRGELWAVGAPVIVAAALLVVGGLAVAVLGIRGLGAALTASPVPLKDAALVTTGIYRRVRHPIYTGLLIIGLGLVAFGSSFWHLAIWVALLVLLAAKARWEERMLLASHDGYRAYGARTGRFVPGIGRLH